MRRLRWAIMRALAGWLAAGIGLFFAGWAILDWWLWYHGRPAMLWWLPVYKWMW